MHTEHIHFEIILLSRPAGGDIGQIRSNMVAILNFKITTVKQFINRPICFLDPKNVGAAAKKYICMLLR